MAGNASNDGKASNKPKVLLVGNTVTYPDKTKRKLPGKRVTLPDRTTTLVAESEYLDYCSLPSKTMAAIWGMNLPPEIEVEIIRSACIYAYTGEMPKDISPVAWVFVDMLTIPIDESRKKARAARISRLAQDWAEGKKGDLESADNADTDTGEIMEAPTPSPAPTPPQQAPAPPQSAPALRPTTPEPKEVTPQHHPQLSTSYPRNLGNGVWELSNGRRVKKNWGGHWEDTQTGEMIDIETGEVDDGIPF